MNTRIVIVEDEPLISEDLATILSKEGYQIVGQAYDGVEAMDIINGQKPDIVLLDISLGTGLSGLEIADYLKSKYKIPFIFITSYSDEYTLDKAKELMPEGYIVKPFKKKDILATVAITMARIQKRPSTPYKSLAELNIGLTDQITPKEYEILLDICKGMNNYDIAEKNFISVNTVKTHLKRSFAKLNIDSRLQVSGLLIRS